ncbi:MAG: hypothetical protein Q9170_004913 [Blastenia crenularia]
MGNWILVTYQKILRANITDQVFWLAPLPWKPSLEEPTSQREYSMKLNWDHRIMLAYRLASSLLQFQSTPWLEGSWKKESIYFPRNPDAGDSFDANSPFIIHDFQGNPIPAPTSQVNAKTSLLDLGILLLEIWHQTPFEAYTKQEGLSLDDTYGTRYGVALRWLHDTADNILPFYSDPVCRCIEGTFVSEAPMLQWTDRRFQSSICESLVKPLWDNCSNQTK